MALPKFSLAAPKNLSCPKLGGAAVPLAPPGPYAYDYINWYTKVILAATFVNFPLDIYHILNDSSLNNCHNKLLENHAFPVYVLIPVNEYYKIYRSK